MDDVLTRRCFLQGFMSTMAASHLLKMPSSLCDQIYESVYHDGRPYYSDPQRLGEFVDPVILGEDRQRYHGHLAIGSCGWLGHLGNEVLGELFRKDRLALELDELNQAAVLDLMDQFWLHDALDKNNPAIAYAVERYVSSAYFLQHQEGLNQEIDFQAKKEKKPAELTTSRSLEVPLFFNSIHISSEPPLIIQPAMWRFAKPQNPSSRLDFHLFTNKKKLFRFAKPQNPSSRLDFHLFTNKKKLFRGEGPHLDEQLGVVPSMKLYFQRGKSIVTTFVPAGVEDGSMMKRVFAEKQVYQYHELFQPVRFKRCLRLQVLLLARFHGEWVNQVNVTLKPPEPGDEASIPLLMDLNLRCQHFDYWVPHHVGLAKQLNEYTARRAPMTRKQRRDNRS
jgi:hypothetical protein